MTITAMDLIGSKARVVDCEDIHVTEPQPIEGGYWMREIRFFGKDDAGNVHLVITVQVTSESKTKLEVTAPPVVIR
jgi:hypothetical protein